MNLCWPFSFKTLPPEPAPPEAATSTAPQRRDGERSEPVSCPGVKLGDQAVTTRQRAPLPGILRTTRTDPRTPTCGVHKTANRCASIDPHDRAKDGEHDRFVTVFTCNNQSCEEPACSRKWTNRRAPPAAARVIGSVYWHEGVNADPIHATLSPPPRDWPMLWEAFEHDTEHAMRKARQEARKIAKKTGIRGGALVFHAHRCKYQNDARGRYDTTPLTWSPHWHVVGGGWIVGTGANYAKTGWVVVNHGKRTDTQGTIEYLLDHCAWVEGGQAITYFGFATPHHTRVEELEKAFEPACCKACGDRIAEHPVGADGIDWDTETGERMLKVRRFVVTAAKRNDKFPLEFRTSADEFTYRMVKPPPGTVVAGEQKRFDVAWAPADYGEHGA